MALTSTSPQSPAHISLPHKARPDPLFERLFRGVGLTRIWKVGGWLSEQQFQAMAAPAEGLSCRRHHPSTTAELVVPWLRDLHGRRWRAGILVVVWYCS